MFTSLFPLFHSGLVEWSEEHDYAFFSREIRLARNIFGAKKGSPAREVAWKAKSTLQNSN